MRLAPDHVVDYELADDALAPAVPEDADARPAGRLERGASEELVRVTAAAAMMLVVEPLTNLLMGPARAPSGEAAMPQVLLMVWLLLAGAMLAGCASPRRVPAPVEDRGTVRPGVMAPAQFGGRSVAVATAGEPAW